MKMKRTISLVVAILFFVNNISYALGPAITSGNLAEETRPETKGEMYALGQKLFAAKIGPGSIDFDNPHRSEFNDLQGRTLRELSEYTAQYNTKFIEADYKNPPADWKNNNPILQQTDLITALKMFGKRSRISSGKLEIKEGWFPVDERTGELLIARIEPLGNGRYVLVVHTKFVQMWNHIRKNDVWLEVNLEPNKRRTVSVAWGIFYRLAKHEMAELSKRDKTFKSLGHIAYNLDIPHDDEGLANEIGGNYAMLNDAAWMWFLGSYCFRNTTRYDNNVFFERINGFFEEKWALERGLNLEFPNLLKNPGKRISAMAFACAVNFNFFNRPNVEVPKKYPETLESFIQHDNRETSRRSAGVTEKYLYATGAGTGAGANEDAGRHLIKTVDELARFLETGKTFNYETKDKSSGTQHIYSVKVYTGRDGTHPELSGEDKKLAIRIVDSDSSTEKRNILTHRTEIFISKDLNSVEDALNSLIQKGFHRRFMSTLLYNIRIDEGQAQLALTVAGQTTTKTASTQAARRNKPGKSPEDLFTLITFTKSEEKALSAPMLLKLYEENYEALGFDKPAEIRNSALKTIERDLYDLDSSLLAQGLVRPQLENGQQKRGEDSEYLFELTEEGRKEAGERVKELAVAEKLAAQLQRENKPLMGEDETYKKFLDMSQSYKDKLSNIDNTDAASFYGDILFDDTLKAISGIVGEVKNIAHNPLSTGFIDKLTGILRELTNLPGRIEKQVLGFDHHSYGYDIPTTASFDTKSARDKASEALAEVQAIRVKAKYEEFKRNSGLPLSLLPKQSPAIVSNNQLWAEVLRALTFENTVYRRVEREDKAGERFTGITAFEEAAIDTDAKGLHKYDVSAPEFYSIRKGEDVRNFILQPEAEIPPEAYFMHRGIFVSREDIQKAFYDNKIRFDITSIPPAIWGVDFAKTVGHYHDPAEKPEIYQVVSGEVLWLMQKTDEKGNVVDFITVRARAGDIAIMLPGYGHVSVNLSRTEPLIMANWLTWHQSSYYGSFKEKKGAAYYVVGQNEGAPALIPNPQYQKTQRSLPEPRQMASKDAVSEFGLKRGTPIYNLVKLEDNEFSRKTRFLYHPEEFAGLLTPQATLDDAREKDKIYLSSLVELLHDQFLSSDANVKALARSSTLRLSQEELKQLINLLQDTYNKRRDKSSTEEHQDYYGLGLEDPAIAAVAKEALEYLEKLEFNLKKTSAPAAGTGETISGVKEPAAVEKSPIPSAISEYVVYIGLDKGPGSLEPTTKEIASFYPIYEILSHQAVEIYLPQAAKGSLTDAVKQEIINLNKRIRERTGRKDDAISLKAYDANNLEKLLENRNEGARRIFVNDNTMTDVFKGLLSQSKAAVLKGSRLITTNMPQTQDKKELSIYQAWLVKVALLSAMVEDSNMLTVGSALQEELKDRLDNDIDINEFIFVLSRTENETMEQVAARINYFLGNIIKVSQFIGEQIRILKAFWTAA